MRAFLRHEYYPVALVQPFCVQNMVRQFVPKYMTQKMHTATHLAV